MTDREAVAILERLFNKSCGDYRYQNKQKLDTEDAMYHAITMLQERIDREKGCEWCIGFCPDVTGDPYADCRFCPMCGRKLKTAMPGGGGRVDHECSLSRM